MDSQHITQIRVDDTYPEKEPVYNVDIGDIDEKPEEEDHEILDHNYPFPPLKGIPSEEQQLTFRAIIIGSLLGAVVSASNIYLGLKTGWTFGPSLFGSIIGFAIIKPLSRAAPRWLGGGYFGPKVGCCIQLGSRMPF